MMIRKLKLIMVFAMISWAAHAQPFLLKSTSGAKPFLMNIYYAAGGEGAYVKYHGQQGFIALSLKNRTAQGKTSTSKVSYTWDELVQGKVTGVYKLSQEGNQVSAASYLRYKDHQLFKLEQAKNHEDGSEKTGFLLHGTVISFSKGMDEMLSFRYPDKITKVHLPGFDSPDPQRIGTIADYNFDGFDDVAFSIPDAGMGVYRTFTIYLYNPVSKRFDLLAEPNDPRAKCSGFCDVTLDKKNKLLITACRGGATWWNNEYKYTTAKHLTWISSKKAEN
ncbi:XAC2610-related protein [Pedobacter sp. KACC 23697]|uniref:VCBS repeat-containing protein n=1 Tax=Pedobacter sp. KACC 23697 TaxID=3149230 RepID=A0AAU7KAR0_9SPHI